MPCCISQEVRGDNERAVAFFKSQKLDDALVLLKELEARVKGALPPKVNTRRQARGGVGAVSTSYSPCWAVTSQTRGSLSTGEAAAAPRRHEQPGLLLLPQRQAQLVDCLHAQGTAGAGAYWLHVYGILMAY